MQADGTIRAIFFDFGGVIVRLDRELLAAYERRHSLAEGSFLKAMYTSPEWRALETGRGSEDAWMDAAKRKLDELAGRTLPPIDDERASMWRRLDHEVVELVRRLRTRYRVGVLSNATDRLEDELDGFHGIGDLFHVVVNSYREGIAKPDERIYRLAAQRIGEVPEACVHIDDLGHNVEGARRAGFKAVHYKGDFAALEQGIRDLGVAW